MYFSPEQNKRFTAHHEIRAAFPTMSLPELLTPEVFAYLGVFELQDNKPEYNPITQGLTDQGQSKVGDVYVINYAVHDLPAEEAQANQAEADKKLKDLIITQTQERLDSFTASRGYTSVDSISKYQNIQDEEIASSPVEQQPLLTKFRAEARYVALVTAQTWAKLYLILDEVIAGTRARPTGIHDIINDLPELSWPV